MFADSLEKSSCDRILKDISSLSYCLLATSKNFEKMFYLPNVCDCSGEKIDWPNIWRPETCIAPHMYDWNDGGGGIVH